MKRAIILVAMVLASAPASRAHAGSFVVHACGASATNNAWQATTPPPGVMEVNESCQSPAPMGGIWVRDVLSSPSDLTDGQGAWLRFDAAPGTTITAITYKRWLWKVSIDDLHPELRLGDGTVLETCSITFGNDRCDLGGDGTAAVTFAGLSTSRLEAGVRCQIADPPATTCPGGGTEHGYGAVIYDAAVTVEDDTPPPAATVEATGLWSGAAWYRASSSVTVSGADASGIKAARIYSDGALIAQEPTTCDLTRPKPCDDAVDLQIPIDTTTLSDGEHDIAVSLIDAADNESATTTRHVLIANHAPGPPTLTLTPTHNQSGQFTLTWATAAGQVVPIALAHLNICHQGSCAQLTTAAHSIALSAGSVGSTSVSVYLEDTTGNADPLTARDAVFTRDPSSTPPPSKPPSSGGGADEHSDPGLRVAAVVGHARVRFVAHLAARARGRITLRVRWRIVRHHKRRWTHTIERQVAIHDGHAALKLKRPALARHAAFVASYAGDAHLHAARARWTITLR